MKNLRKSKDLFLLFGDMAVESLASNMRCSESIEHPKPLLFTPRFTPDNRRCCRRLDPWFYCFIFSWRVGLWLTLTKSTSFYRARESFYNSHWVHIGHNYINSFSVLHSIAKFWNLVRRVVASNLTFFEHELLVKFLHFVRK